MMYNFVRGCSFKELPNPAILW